MRTLITAIALLGTLTACSPRQSEPPAEELPRAETLGDVVGGPVELEDAAAGTPADLLGSAWQWVSFHSGKEAFDIEHPERYTIAFEEDGIAFIQADCNRGSGSVTTDGPGTITIGPIALTKMLCPPESHGDLFVQSLEHAVLYFFQDVTLYIERPIESGTLGFERVSPETTP